MEKEQVNLLIFGAPGSGKGTQARLLGEYLKGLEVISMGDLLRAEVASKTVIGVEVEAIMQEGRLVGDPLVCEMIFRKLRRVSAGFLLDGFPRNLPQAEFLTAVMRLLNRKIDAVLKLEVDAAVVENRLQGRLVCKGCGAVSNAVFNHGACQACGCEEYVRRNDDSLNVIRRRLMDYDREVTVLEGYYQDKVIRINGDRTVEEIHGDVKHVLDRLNN
ncbi:Adenylate kinase [Anaplasma phagocytophilum]|uniref:Adenylate kinase n=2 Tax=Anaplasma phagocytophilum TaxID=948 RepID=A0A7H9DYE4_ANAPH|nr:nucleoside monophosphate kinase [Anaplasma phagocytophilum]KJV67501.1 adenylate kinase family protein [Anaplasma phagocytophilum str. ApNP]QLL66525.1 adenylate kinase [Anaplasma phagocytophilum str. Norway variant1]SCV62027.1 Adenylate kinase [Anaplasma phagocytophilum]